MNTIKRDVYVLRNTIKIPIEVTKGTDMVGIEFTVRDFDIPATAAAVAYSYSRKMKKPNSQLCDVKGDVISFTPGREFFSVGMNELQIRVINEDKALISFKEKVKCSDAMRFPDDEEGKQQTLIEQLLSNSGKETGERKKADETERNERTAAIEKEKSERTQADATEKSERKAEIDVERKRIDNLAKLPAGSTTGDAELKDIRVGADGTIHGTAGEAVRQQVGSLKEDLDDAFDIVSDNKVRNITWEQGSLYPANGSENDNLNTTRIRSGFVETKDSVMHYHSDNSLLRAIAFIYDENKMFVRATGALYNTNFSANGSYVRFVLYLDGNLLIDTSYGKECVINYPNIKNIKEEVEELKNPVKKFKYVAFGDSFTIGRRSDDWIMQTDRAYPAVFGKYFNYNVLNLGVGGQGLSYNATESIINLAYDHVIAHHDDIIDADLITFKWGNNDRGSGKLESCVLAYKNIFDYIKTVNPYARIVVLSPNNVTSSGTAEDGYWLNGSGKFTLNEFHSAVRRLCEQYNITYVDVNKWSSIDSLADCLGDNIHPKNEAFEKYHRYVALCVASAINNNLKSKDIDLGNFTNLTYIHKDTGLQKSDTSIMSSSDFIEIASNATIHFDDIAVQRNASICEYDISKKFIRALVGGSYDTSHTLKTSANARYIRVTAKKLDETRPSAYYVNDDDIVFSNLKNSYLSAKSYPLTSIKKKAIFTVIDDDTSTLDYVKRYHDLCINLGIRGNFAVITSHTEESESLTAKLLEYEEEGFGMLYHCYSQTPIWSWTSAFDLEECEKNYVKGKRLYHKAGFASGSEFFIAPFGNNRATVQDMVKRHGCEVLLSTDNNIIIGYDGTTSRYNIPRCSLGHNADRYPNFTIEQLKAKIDEAYANNGWIIITTHVNEWGTTTDGEQRFSEVVNYAKNKGLECKPFAEAYEDRKSMFYAFETM